jgi:hypothetical protein
MADSIPSSKVRVRLAAPADIHRLVRLLPEGAGSPACARYLLAEDDPSGELLGGAYVTFRSDARRGKTAVFGLAVPDEARAAELGSLLLRACVVQARSDGVATLAFDGMVAEGTSLDALLKTHTFTAVQILTEYVMDGQAMLKACNSAYRWVERKGGIPDDARVTALKEAPVHSVQHLIRRYFGGAPPLRWWTPESKVVSEVSTVVMIGTRVVAALIIRDVDGEAESPHVVVEKEFRHGWVTIALWRRAVCKGLEAGYDHVRFFTGEEQFRSFANFARRMKSESLGRKTRYELALDT